MRKQVGLITLALLLAACEQEDHKVNDKVICIRGSQIGFCPRKPAEPGIQSTDVPALFAVDTTRGTQALVSVGRVIGSLDHPAEAQVPAGATVERGSGSAFVWPIAVGFDDRRQRLIVLDHGQRALVAVDASGGGRTLLAGNFWDPAGLAIDPVAGSALVIDTGHRTLFEISLASGQSLPVSGPGRGSGPVFERPTAVAVDPLTATAFVVDSQRRALVSVDLDTGDRTIIANDVIGGGPALWDPAQRRVLVHEVSYVVSFDPVTGERVSEFYSRFDDGGEGLTNMSYDADRNRVLLVGRGFGSPFLKARVYQGPDVPWRSQEVRSLNAPALGGDPGPGFGDPQGVTSAGNMVYVVGQVTVWQNR